MHVPAVYMSGRPAVSVDSGGAMPDAPASATTCGSPRHAGMDGVGVAGGVPVRLPVPVALTVPVSEALDDGVPVWLPVPMALDDAVPVAELEPVRVPLDVCEPVRLPDVLPVGLPKELRVPVALMDGGVPVTDEVCEPVNDLLGDDVHVLLAMMVGESKGVSVESEAGRQGSATPPDENAVGTAV